MEPQHAFNAALADCREGLRTLGTEQDIDFAIAYHFVERSAWWNHPRAGWTRAPKHANHINRGSYGWEVRFGANSFLVEHAVKRFIDSVRFFLYKVESGHPASYGELLGDLRISVATSVGNYQGDKYPGIYPVKDGRMVFGTQAICIMDCVDIVVDRARLDKHFARR